MSGIEALYLYNEHNDLLLAHTFTSRPPSATTVLPLYLTQPAPRSSVIYLPSVNPPTVLYSIIQDRLLFLAPCSSDVEPLLVLEFLHRVADALEEFVGSPLLSTRIETSYDVIAQVLGEMCDSGLIASTEANALRDVVETPSLMGKLLGGVGLPGSSPALNSSSGPLSLQRPSMSPALSSSGSQIPWRRSNVRHTSNELYVDMVETLSVVYAPSGRPLSAFANGSIAFTCKVSGVPDLLLVLTAGSGGSGNLDRGEKVRRIMERPVFHPCVRLSRWKQHGELSFVPPDGRFVLAGYEVDLLDNTVGPLAQKASNLNLPATVRIKTNLGPAGTEIEVRLTLNQRFQGSTTGSAGVSSSGAGSGGLGGNAAASLAGHLGRPGGGPRTASGDAKSSVIEHITVSVPVPTSVRNISDMRPSKGEAHWSPGEVSVQWTLSNKDISTIGSGAAVLRCTLVGPISDDDEGGMSFGTNGTTTDTYDYNEDVGGTNYQSGSSGGKTPGSTNPQKDEQKDARRARINAGLMPTSVNLSFSIKGWLASGLRVDNLSIDARKSKGLGDGVKPYKGVKYLTVSRGGIETRCQHSET